MAELKEAIELDMNILVEPFDRGNYALDAAKSVRSRDLKGKQFEWVNPTILHEFDEGELKDHSIAMIDDPDDLALLGSTMGHCAGTHWIWASEEKLWYFFTILGPNGQPHCTLHAKWKKWMGKPHPRDTAPKIPYALSRSSNGYSCLADVKKAMGAHGVEYEPGKYGPVQYKSTTYEHGAQEGYYDRDTWNNRYGRDPIGVKPVHVSDENWLAFQKAWKAMSDEYDKNSGSVQMAGRVFKFDHKELIILSFSTKGQNGGGNQYRKGFHEWLVSLNKRKKEVEVGS